MAKTVRSRKQKGMRAQKEVKKMIHDNFKDLRDKDIKTATAGEPGVDIFLSPKASSRLPLSIEVKNTEKLNIWKSIDQAKMNEDQNCKWALFFKRNHSDMYVCVEAEWFLTIMSQLTKP